MLNQTCITSPSILFVHHYYLLTDAPKVSILQAVSGRIVINESSSLSLTCQVDARPEAHTVMWKKPGRVPVQGPVLTLNNVKRQQGGVYTCEATNQLLPTGKPAKSGVSNASVELVVQCEILLKSIRLIE